MDTKICKICKIEKPISEYSFRSGKMDVLHSWCKICKKEYNRQYREKNIDRIKRMDAEYYQDNKTEILEYRSKYYQMNREQYIEKTRAYHKSHPSINKKSAKKYRCKNHEKIKNIHKKYRLELNDNYIKAKLTTNSVLKFADIPPELVEITRLQLTLKRLNNANKNNQ